MDRTETLLQPTPAAPLAYSNESIPAEWGAMVSVVATVGLVVAAGRIAMLAAAIVMYADRAAGFPITGFVYGGLQGVSGLALAVACIRLLTHRSRSVTLLWWIEVLTFAALAAATTYSTVVEWPRAGAGSRGMHYYFMLNSASHLFVTGGFSLIVILLGLRITRVRGGMG